MTFTRRGKIAAGLGAAAVVLGGGIGILALTGNADKIPIVKDIPGIKHAPPTCPLTGVRVKAAPDRPALAIKVENLPEARPQAGLNSADIVYEEPVEGGITRFIVMFQCRDSQRVGPVRSARLTDPPILLQYGTQTLFGYAGGAPAVEKAVAASGIHDLSFNVAAAVGAYHRDSSRSAPHNLYTSTRELYRAGHAKGGRPHPVFSYAPKIPNKSKLVHMVHLDFSGTANVFWKWDPKGRDWVRSYDTGPAVLEGNVPITAKNVVVQAVKVFNSGVVDVAGNPSPEVKSVGSGKAFVFRNGRMIQGTWQRSSIGDVTKFVDKAGKEIPLAPGETWVELLPSTISVQTG